MKTKTYSFPIKENRVNIPVRILIPKVHRKLFFKTLSEFGGDKAKLLEYMTNRFQDGKNLEYTCRTKFTTHYQEKGLHLHEYDFRVDPLIWYRFKCLARFYGISMCLLFVILLVRIKGVVTTQEKRGPSLIKLFERVKIPYKTAMRWYKVEILDTS